MRGSVGYRRIQSDEFPKAYWFLNLNGLGPLVSIGPYNFLLLFLSAVCEAVAIVLMVVLEWTGIPGHRNLLSLRH